jgi:hypothetical protein
METELVGTLIRLPDGQRVTIETVHVDDYVSLRRVDDERAGRIAVCAIEKLEPKAGRDSLGL